MQIKTTEGSLLARALTVTLAETLDPQRAADSRFCWRRCNIGVTGTTTRADVPVLGAYVYRLTPLGILHALFGISLSTRSKP